MSKPLILAPTVRIDHAASTDDHTVIVDSATGRRLSLSDSARAVLALFGQPTTAHQAIAYAASHLGLRPSATRQAIAHLQRLSIVTNASTRKVEDARHQRILADKVLVMNPKRRFCHCEAAGLSEVPERAVAICGIPSDNGTSELPGARLGPDKIRETSTRQAAYEKSPVSGAGRGWHDVAAGESLLKDVSIADVGDVIVLPGENNDAVIQRSSRAARALAQQDCLPVFLGGDHSISYATVKAFATASRDLTIVAFDAHADRGSWERGTPHHHANVFTRLLAEFPNLRLWQLGLRGLAYEQGHRRVTTISAQQLRREADLTRLVPRGTRCFISIDVDVLDPAFVSSTGTPAPFGIDGMVLLDIVTAICKNNFVLGLDVVELNPLVGAPDASADLVVALLLHAIHAAYESRYSETGGNRGRAR